jgi:hypothetical protein
MVTTQKIIKALAVIWESENKDRRNNSLALIYYYMHSMQAQEIYPQGFGEQLLEFINTHSKDPIRGFEIENITRLFSLAVKIANNTAQNHIIEMADMIALFTAISKLFYIHFNIDEAFQSPRSIISKVLFETMIRKMSPEKISKEVTVPLEAAMRSFKTIFQQQECTYHDFLDEITRFYVHILVSTNLISPDETVDKTFMKAEAISVLQEAFGSESGHKYGHILAKEKIQGGINTVFRKMISVLEQKERLKILRQAWIEICPADWFARVAMTKEFMDIARPSLSKTVADLPPAMFADNVESIIDGYISSMENIKNLMKSF